MKILHTILVAIFLAIIPAGFAAEAVGFSIGSINIGYMSQEEFGARVTADEISDYIIGLGAKCTEFYSKDKAPRQFYIVLIVHSGHSHFWFTDGDGKELRKMASIEKLLREVPIPNRRAGPIVFALDARIAGGQPVKEDGAPPMPETWKKALSKSKSNGSMHIDDVVRLVCTSAVSDDMIPPEGYVIQKLDPLGGEVLRPKDWHFYVAEKQGTLVYKITKEPIAKGSEPETDLTINIVPGIRKKTGEPTSGYLRYFFDKKKASSTIVSKEEIRGQGEFQRLGFLTDEELTIGGETKIHRVSYALFADDKRDLLVIFIFGCPRDEWEGNEAICHAMCDRIKIYDDKHNNLPGPTAKPTQTPGGRG